MMIGVAHPAVRAAKTIRAAAVRAAKTIRAAAVRAATMAAWTIRVVHVPSARMMTAVGRRLAVRAARMTIHVGAVMLWMMRRPAAAMIPMLRAVAPVGAAKRMATTWMSRA
jgi:hypothetical protein